METLQRIANTFQNLRNVLINRNGGEALKSHIEMLTADLKVLKENREFSIRALAMEGYLALLTAKILSNTITEKQEILQSSFNKLKPYAMREEILFIFLRIQNLLCFYLIQQDQIAESREILENMERLYEQMSAYQPDRYLDAENLFSTEPLDSIKRVNPEKIDKMITKNILMQAFIYNKINEPDKYVLYNHTALRRQLEMKEGTPQEWALRAARLGSHFTHLNQFGNARHHLCAAYCILRNCHDRCKMVPAEFVKEKNDFEFYFLELTHHWVKYGLNLFKYSKKNIFNSYFKNTEPSAANVWEQIDLTEHNNTVGNGVLENNEEGKDAGRKDDSELKKLFKFPTLDLKEMEAKVPAGVKELKDARKLFAFTHKWLMRASRYYDMETHSAQYASCSLQLAELYEHLAFFEHSIDNQYNIQRRRADVLENLNSVLKSCESLPIRIDVIRELSQVQLELMALNLQKLWREESQGSVLNLDNDGESIISCLNSHSNKSIVNKTMLLRKMEAATAINSRLFRMSSQLGENGLKTPSQLSFNANNN